MRQDADILIVGSGVGGSTLAKELAESGKKILVAEKGNSIAPKQMGSEFRAFKLYDKFGLWSKTKEGVFYYRTIMVGGTSVVSCGNAVRSLEKEFKKLGIDLKNEFQEAEKELGVRSVPDKFIGRASRKIITAAKDLGFKMQPMPKLINFKKCVSCGNCVVGCLTGAKWSALDYLKKAKEKGASLVSGVDVAKILISRGHAIGIQGVDRKGKKIKLFAPVVILAAGGIGTPIILQNSGIKAGQKLFLDLFNVTMGLSKGAGQAKELTMAAVIHQNGFILSPFVDPPFAFASVVPVPLRRDLKITMHRDHMLGIMVKINDDSLGKVFADGKLAKTLTPEDLYKLNKGTDIAKRILIKAGVDPKSIVTTKIRGAHPGGTAAIGEVVNKNLRTKIKGLFVCDASVLPVSPGLPPILTLIALAKRLAKQLK